MRRFLLLCALLSVNHAVGAEEAAPPEPAARVINRSTAEYRLPDVMLTRADGTRVHFLREIGDGRPVILNFVFTSCSTICPVMTRTFATVQTRLDGAGAPMHMISISMDPEEDTPPRLRDYARLHGAGPRWDFYTGSYEASLALQKAFRAWRGDKMAHPPVTFIRRAPNEPWVRLEGLAAPEEILGEFRRSVAAR
jgi:protein SCO1/2